jgi:hypothetical protein
MQISSLSNNIIYKRQGPLVVIVLFDTWFVEPILNPSFGQKRTHAFRGGTEPRPGQIV